MQTTTLTTDNIKGLVLQFAETSDYYFIEQMAKILKVHESKVYQVIKEIDSDYKTATKTKKALLVNIAVGKLWKLHHTNIERIIRNKVSEFGDN